MAEQDNLGRSYYINRISMQLSSLVSNVKTSNAENRFDIAILAERTICDLLNLMFGWQLTNVNTGSHTNSPGLDLVDEKACVAVQVTAINSLRKVDHMLETFKKYKLNREFSRLIMLIITEDAPTRAMQEREDMCFYGKRDIWNIPRLMRQIESTQDIDNLRAIAAYLDKETDRLPTRPQYSPAKELSYQGKPSGNHLPESEPIKTTPPEKNTAHRAGNYVFISYSSKNHNLAVELKNYLNHNNIACWMAPNSIPVGSNYTSEIPNAIEHCKVFILLLTKEAQKSQWVPKELGSAISAGKKILPLQVGTFKLSQSFSFQLEGIQIIEAHGRRNETYEELIIQINEGFSTSPSTPPPSRPSASSPHPKWWMLAILIAALAIIGFILFPWHQHVWERATCTDPKTCIKCGETEGTALGHNWSEATCTTPRICTECNETEGTALGHNWTEATCTAPQTCSLCGYTVGSTAAHTWENATYSDPKKCTVCGLTEGVSLGTPLIRCNIISDSQSDRNNDIITGSYQDISGNRYPNAVTFWVMDSGEYANSEYVVYILGSEYEILDCCIALGSKSKSGAAVRFYFYGDDSLIYQSDYISGTDVCSFQIDVSNIYHLRVECETDENVNSYGILEATLHHK